VQLFASESLLYTLIDADFSSQLDPKIKNSLSFLVDGAIKGKYEFIKQSSLVDLVDDVH